MRRWKTSLASCFVLAILGSAVLAPQAIANREDCPSQYVCLWDGPTYGEERRQFHDNGLQNLTDFSFNDRTSSIYNNTNRWAAIYEHTWGGGSRRCIRPGQAYSLSGDALNNQASSIQISPSAIC